MPPQLSFLGPGRLSIKGGETPEADPSESLIDDLLEKMDVGEKPEPPPKIGRGRRIIGSIGDALTAMAAVRAGGTPPARGAFASQLLRQQEEFRIASAQFKQQQADLNNEILLFKARMAEADEARIQREQADISKTERADVLLRERAVEADKRIAARQLEDDERDAEIALNKWKDQKIFELSRIAADAGLPGDILKGIDPRKLSRPDLIDLSLQINSQITGKAITQADRIKAQVDAAKEADPALDLSGVRFSGKDGVANASFAFSQLERLSPADRGRAIEAGIDVFNPDGTARSAAEIIDDVTAIKKSELEVKGKERDARLRILLRRSNLPGGTVGMKIVEHVDMLQNAEVALSRLTGTGDSPGGPIAGRIPPAIRYMTVQVFYGKKAVDLNRDITIRVNRIFNIVAKIRSGAAVTLPEEIRLQPELVKMVDTKQTMIKKLELLIEFEKRFIRNMEKVHNLLPTDIDFLGDRLSTSVFIPTQGESGDLVIFGGDQ